MNARADYQHQLTQYRLRLEKSLDLYLPPAHLHPELLHSAMRYSVLSGGKRLRALLVYASGVAAGANLDDLDAPACAVEFLHAYSLIHDDLPAMDNADLRRGRQSCHRTYGEAMAILAGDALQSMAFYCLTHHRGEVPPQQVLQQLETLGLAAGSRGMVGGQAIDLLSVGKELNLAELEDMHIHKTGALIRASVLLGALSAPALEVDFFQQLDHYGRRIGLAFQIQDDILDVEGEAAVLGKPQNADLDKPTYPRLLGLSSAKAHLAALLAQIQEILQPLGERGNMLKFLAEYSATRTH